MPRNGDQAVVRIGAQGRIVIPAGLREALGLAQGDLLVARTDGDRLVLERRAAVLSRLQERFAAVPADMSLADAVIAERRAEARREEKP
jgi:AbrB family looped-hinge helix DNA binding protein